MGESEVFTPRYRVGNGLTCVGLEVGKYCVSNLSISND